MLTDFNDRLAIAKTNLRQRDKLESMLRSARLLLSEAKHERANLKQIVEKEHSDLAALEGLSLTALFHAVLGSKEQRLEKERKEFVAAKLKFDQANATVDDLSEEVQRLEEKSSRLENAGAEYERVVVEKEQYLSENDSDIARKLVDLTQRLADLAADHNELDEAVDAGQFALQAVKRIQDTLASAANWGVMDMFGGGMLTTMAKHSKIDTAKDQARIAQRRLLRFEEELADADERLQVSLQIDGFSKFADYFFDGLISDWIVQTKISKARAECSSIISRVKAAVRACQNRRESVESEIKSLTESKRNLIETG
ncbi:hypothetical protein RMSM_05375 [Rhodopirellula maiorica SM1]|uniref:Uncharacterized protein n=1 Tax=Rhodopirellula maiorica SM1 TaxID=1265738 RepID=M5RQP7_9BACT|nr:hypothetical protein [Rhodopirellula maiorica]EMI17707.1 hypothetical protein RMSM_05375 [Rhodopirellula maiorica SM1]